MQGSLCGDGDAAFPHRDIMVLTCSHAQILQAPVHQWLSSLQHPMLETSPAQRVCRLGSHAWALSLQVPHPFSASRLPWDSLKEQGGQERDGENRHLWWHPISPSGV